MTIEERNNLIVNNLNLVHHIAKKIYISPNAYYSYEDVIQEGNIGLIKAAERFDPELGFKFSTYAGSMIYGEMRRFVRDNMGMMHYSRSDLDAYMKVVKLGKPFEELTNEDLASLGIAPSKIYAILTLGEKLSINNTYEDSESEWINSIADKSTQEVSEEYQESMFDQVKDLALSKFSDNNRDLLEEWYYSQQIGLSTGQMYLAAKYSLSQAQVSRIIRDFKKRLLVVLENSGYDIDCYKRR